MVKNVSILQIVVVVSLATLYFSGAVMEAVLSYWKKYKRSIVLVFLVFLSCGALRERRPLRPPGEAEAEQARVVVHAEA